MVNKIALLIYIMLDQWSGIAKNKWDKNGKCNSDPKRTTTCSKFKLSMIEWLWYDVYDRLATISFRNQEHVVNKIVALIYIMLDQWSSIAKNKLDRNDKCNSNPKRTSTCCRFKLSMNLIEWLYDIL